MVEKFFYPCVITEEEGIYYINFPDFKACFTDGETMEEALDNAKAVLTAVLIEMTKYNEELPKPSRPKADESNWVVVIDVVKNYVLSKVNNQSVKKTLTIPKWLNDLALEQNINFSQVLQEALKDKLQIQQKH